MKIFARLLLITTFFCPLGVRSEELNINLILERLKSLEQKNIELQNELIFLRNQISPSNKNLIANPQKSIKENDFIKTTKISGKGIMVFGSKNFTGGNNSGTYDGKQRNDYLKENEGGTTFTYNHQLDIDSSFSKRDFLKARFKYGKGGQFSGTTFVGEQLGLGELDDFDTTAFGLDRFWYRYSLTDNFTAFYGPEISQEDMLAIWPSMYTRENILDFFNYSGAPGVYNKNKGGGLGLIWENNGWGLSLNYTSDNATDSDPKYPFGGGMFTDSAGSNTTLQVGYEKDLWGLAAAYSITNTNTRDIGFKSSNATPLSVQVQEIGKLYSLGISGWFRPLSNFSPAVSAGIGFSEVKEDKSVSACENSSRCNTYESASFSSWSLAMQWDDLFKEDNIGGIAFGQPVHVTSIKRDSGDNSVNDSVHAYEIWYKIKLNDSVSFTPAFYLIDRPLGYYEDSGSNAGKSFNEFGAIIKSTFNF